MAPPGPRQVMEASAKQVLRRLDVIDEDVKAFFQPAAQLVMAESDPEDALCRALAALSGLLEVPKPRRYFPLPTAFSQSVAPANEVFVVSHARHNSQSSMQMGSSVSCLSYWLPLPLLKPLQAPKAVFCMQASLMPQKEVWPVENFDIPPHH